MSEVFIQFFSIVNSGKKFGYKSLSFTMTIGVFSKSRKIGVLFDVKIKLKISCYFMIFQNSSFFGIVSFLFS